MSQKQQFDDSGFLLRSMVSVVVGLLYFAGCVCPAVKVHNPGPAMMNLLLMSLGGNPDAQGPEYQEFFGLEALLGGWQPPLTIPWSANLLVGGILLLCKKNAVGLGFGSAAALAGLSTWVVLPGGAQLLVGYYLWQASLIAFALGAFATCFREPGKEGSIRGA